jgi:hypothetical protein
MYRVKLTSKKSPGELVPCHLAIAMNVYKTVSLLLPGMPICTHNLKPNSARTTHLNNTAAA